MRSIMISSIPPALLFIIGVLPIPFLRGRRKSFYLLLLPVIGMINLLNMEEGVQWTMTFLEFEVVLGHVDKLSLVFG